MRHGGGQRRGFHPAREGFQPDLDGVGRGGHQRFSDVALHVGGNGNIRKFAVVDVIDVGCAGEGIAEFKIGAASREGEGQTEQHGGDKATHEASRL